MGEIRSRHMRDDTWAGSLVGKFEWRALLRRLKRGWNNNTKTNVRKTGCQSEVRVYLALSPQAECIEHCNEPSVYTNGGQCID